VAKTGDDSSHRFAGRRDFSVGVVLHTVPESLDSNPLCDSPNAQQVSGQSHSTLHIHSPAQHSPSVGERLWQGGPSVGEEFAGVAHQRHLPPSLWSRDTMAHHVAEGEYEVNSRFLNIGQQRYNSEAQSLRCPERSMSQCFAPSWLLRFQSSGQEIS